MRLKGFHSLEIESAMSCGIDEAGRGPLIGPMVIGKVCGEPEILRQLGARDSKLIKASRREAIFEELVEHAENIDYIIIPEETIDSYVNKNQLNHMEAEYMALLIDRENKYIVDCPDTDENRFRSLLISLTGNEKIIAKHKADFYYPEVGAASIVAKVIREREIEKIKSEIGEFGSGYPSDPRTIEFVRKYYQDKHQLPPHIRKTWKTLTKIINVDSF